MKLVEKQRTDLARFKDISYDRFLQRLPQKHINLLFREVPRLALSDSFMEQWFSTNFVQKYPYLAEDNNKLSFSEK